MTSNDFSACLYDPIIKIWNSTDAFKRCVSRDLRYLANNKSFLSHELPCLRILFVAHKATNKNAVFVIL